MIENSGGDGLKRNLFSLIEFQQLGIQYRHVLGLQGFLLCVEQVAFLCQQFYGVLHAEVELLLDEVVAGLRAAQLLYGGNVTLLCAAGIQPQSFDGFIQGFLVVQQIQFAGLFLDFGFLYGTLGLTVVEDGHTYGHPQ